MTDNSGGQIVERLQTILPWLGLLVVLITVLAFVIGLILRLYNYYRKYKQEAVLLELTPPAFTKKAQLFGVIFKKLPTYNDLAFRNQKSPHITGVNPVFQALLGDNFPMVIPRRIELLLPG